MKSKPVLRSYEEINSRIRTGDAVIITAEEMTDLARSEGVEAAARKIDVVTTGTFGPMCSSGAFLNIGHTRPRIKLQKAWLNGVPAYAGVAAVDLYVGATSIPERDPANALFPGEFSYGGGHVIEDLVRGRDVEFRGEAYGNDCYPRRVAESRVNLRTLGDALLVNPRNAYQNYNVAVNSSCDREIYTYLGILRPGMANAGYSCAGQLSPLLNDPFYRTIGIGTRILLGGGVGYVAFHGTQHNPRVERTPGGIPVEGAGTLTVVGDLKGMSPEHLRGVSIRGYGASLAVGIGVPIPVLDLEMAEFTAVADADIRAPVVDYSVGYPERTGDAVIGHVTCEELRRGCFDLEGREVRCSSVSSYWKARKVAEDLKQMLQKGEFLLSKPSAPIPGPVVGEGREVAQV